MAKKADLKKIRERLGKLNKRDQSILDAIDSRYRDFFFVSEKMSATKKKFAVLRPDAFTDFLSFLIKDEDMESRTKLLILLMSCGAMRISEALDLTVNNFTRTENEKGLPRYVIENKVLKKRPNISYKELISYYIEDSGKVNANSDRKASRYESIDTAIKAWIETCNLGVELSQLAPKMIEEIKEQYSESSGLVNSLTTFRANSKKITLDSIVGPEFTQRFDILIDEIERKHSKGVSNDIKRLRQVFMEAKEEGHFNDATRKFDVIIDKGGVIDNLILEILEETFRNDPIFTSRHARSKRRFKGKEGAQVGRLRNLSPKRASENIKKALGDGITTHSFRHSFITYKLKMGVSKAEISRILQVSESVLIRYTNLVDIDNPSNFTEISI